MDTLSESNLKWFKMKKPRISIIGLGQVGNALLKALKKNGYEVISVFNRSEIADSQIEQYPDTDFFTGLPSQNTLIGEIIIVAVSDDAIYKVSNDLAGRFKSLKGKFVAHCSGTHSSEALEVIQSIGAKTASFHPMKAITKSTDSFEGTWFDIEGDDHFLKMLEKIAIDLNAKTFRVEPKAKPYLHASAVVASNYLVVLAGLISQISEQGNVDKQTLLKALTPLMENTLQNINELGVVNALTGPIARGDINTIQKHLESLKNVPEVCSLYKTLGIEAVKIAEQKNGASQALVEIKKLFRED